MQMRNDMNRAWRKGRKVENAAARINSGTLPRHGQTNIFYKTTSVSRNGRRETRVHEGGGGGDDKRTVWTTSERTPL
ncbi:hypothetical protein M407DRAFT_119607 [Tulasnella calospora MUT 4182]|uniref:Uncharacterized protein n=1 Tax=Tulasnella calospora MUT 4182 TaxID=1051891 RepID=A0A0C3Q1V6_9AGAM|nr:hypothetical protein M407DRAFT_119607 [Tulasnella calospora MUT 4182]